MLFAIDIGNTNLHIGFFEDEHLVCHFRIGTNPRSSEDEYEWAFRSLCQLHGISLQDVTGVILGSVVPSVTDRVRSAISRLTSAHILTVGPGVKTGFPIRVDDPAQLGADIVATVAATVATVASPAIVVDFGTATVVSVIDSSGAYCGSSILPGVQMSLDALQTAELLPDLSFSHRNVPILGKNTADCMQIGVLRGTALAVTGFAELYKKEGTLPADTPLVVCGGAADSLIPYLPANIRHIPLLSLQGLQVIHRLNEKKKR